MRIALAILCFIMLIVILTIPSLDSSPLLPTSGPGSCLNHLENLVPWSSFWSPNVFCWSRLSRNVKHLLRIFAKHLRRQPFIYTLWLTFLSGCSWTFWGDVFEICNGKTGETVELVCLTWEFGTPFFTRLRFMKWGIGGKTGICNIVHLVRLYKHLTILYIFLSNCTFGHYLNYMSCFGVECGHSLCYT